MVTLGNSGNLHDRPPAARELLRECWWKGRTGGVRNRTTYNKYKAQVEKVIHGAYKKYSLTVIIRFFRSNKQVTYIT